MVGRLMQGGAALGLLFVLGGCSATSADPPTADASSVSLENLMDRVPGGAQILMGMGSVEQTGVSAIARLEAHPGTALTMVAVCGGPGTLHLELEHDDGLVVPCDSKVVTTDIVAGPGARPDTVTITLEPGNSYSTLVYTAESEPED